MDRTLDEFGYRYYRIQHVLYDCAFLGVMPLEPKLWNDQSFGGAFQH